MKPIDRAAQVYGREWCARTFEEDLQLHFRYGYVVSTPRVFAMGRAVDSEARGGLVVNPVVRFDKPDAWLVYLMAGDLREALRFLPYRLPKIGFERKNILRFYGFEDFTSRIDGAIIPSTSQTSGASLP